MRRIVIGLLGVVFGLLLLAAGILGHAHWQIRRVAPRLPAPVVVAGAAESGGPARLFWIETAFQGMPRSAVLDPARDPSPDAPYTMSFPAFVLEWEDGRLLLIDAGMTRAEALRFGRPLEWVAGAGPMTTVAPVAEQLGPASARLEGVLFTHLHSDHVEGLGALCASHPAPITVFATRNQVERRNHTTRPGAQMIDESGCGRWHVLEGEGLLAVPGFPGVRVIPAGGHTPGSQIVVAFVGERGFVVTGDSVNHLDAVKLDLPKPFLYRLLVVPEWEGRQQELRGFLRALDGMGLRLLVPHDRQALEASGVERWSARVRARQSG